MKNKTIKTEQQVVNKIRAMQDFTYYLRDTKKRYIVSIENLHTSKNPSQFYDNLIKNIYRIIGSTYLKIHGNYDSLGGWMDKETGLYSVDLNLHFNDLNDAVSNAKKFNQIAIFDTLENKTILIN